MNLPPQGHAKPARSNLQLRIASALILATEALAATVAGGVAFRILAVLVAGLVFYEWMAMRPEQGATRLLLVWSALCATLVVIVAGNGAELSLLVMAGAFLIVLIHGLAVGRGAWAAWGLLYACAPAAALVYLRGSDSVGLAAILYLFAVVWVTDSAAYFAGRALGGPKLAPAISPGKTWSGAAGGTLGGMAAGMAVAWIAAGAGAVVSAAVAALLLSVASQAGDLFESALKRRNGVKDSGALIPGHGGVMDRVDGLVAAAVLFFALSALLRGGGAAGGSFLFG